MKPDATIGIKDEVDELAQSVEELMSAISQLNEQIFPVLFIIPNDSYKNDFEKQSGPTSLVGEIGVINRKVQIMLAQTRSVILSILFKFRT